jgi:high-affinity Fe2+/Pb2+ permease
MGFGFLYNDLVAGLFIGLGLGFFVFAIVSNIKNKK